ncbi:acid-sensing ion channel 1C-like [Saccostrea cucullata]|uniref:acid-sensing ion channel 1C-like n=1 Tax=Saccostrea cuccullata TaxID=36930 RepID=UPI002ED4C144
MESVFWAVLTSVVLIAFLVVASLLFANYGDLNTLTTISVKLKEELDFPAVTICPLSKYNFSKIQNNTSLLRYLSLVSITSTPSSGIELNFSDPENAFLHEDEIDSWLASVGFEVNKTFLSCSYRGQMMKCFDLIRVKQTDMGSCFLFDNSFMSPTSNPGKSHGLSLLLHIDQDNFLHTESMAVGMSDVYLAAPYVAFTDGYCDDVTSPNFKSPLKYHDIYSHHACVRECKSRFIISQCECRGHTYPGLEKLCSFHKIHTCVHAQEDVFEQLNSQRDICSCPRPCIRTYFEKEISLARLGKSSSVFRSNGQNFSRENLAQVSIYYRSLIRERRKQVPKMNLLSLLGNLGGYMGIFLGASILSLVELAQAILQTVKHTIKTIRLRKNKEENSKDDVYVIMEQIYP